MMFIAKILKIVNFRFMLDFFEMTFNVLYKNAIIFDKNAYFLTKLLHLSTYYLNTLTNHKLSVTINIPIVCKVNYGKE